MLHLLTSVETPRTFAPTYAYAIDWTEIEEASRRAASELVARAVEKVDVPTVSDIVSTPPGAALEGLSKEVDLVVTGSRGYGAFRRVALGSTSDWLAHHAACPLLVVPDASAGREQPVVGEVAHA
jgi:nucleotide-binding universal stress UspA family protein